MSQASAQDTSINENSGNKVEFLSNEILVKIKKGSRNKILTDNGANSGIDSLSKKFKKQKITKFEKLIKSSKNQTADINGWYVITLSGKKNKLQGKIDTKTKNVLPVDSQGQEVMDNISEYKSDPAVEAAEPNYVVSVVKSLVPSSADLVGWWKFDETTGATAADSSASNNTGTLVNFGAAPWVTGVIDGALSFDGIDDYVSMSANLFPGGSSDRTISTWIKTTTGGNQTIFNYGSGSGIFEMASSGGSVYIDHDGGGPVNYTTRNAGINNGNWHMVTFTFATGAATVYVDGVSIDTRGISLNTSLNAAEIGSRVDQQYHFAGSLDDIRVYDYALSSSEVSLLYSTNQPPTPTLTPTPTLSPTIQPTPYPSWYPNDPYYSSKGSWGQSYDDLWGFKKINMEGAWKASTGSASVIIADVDTGVDRNHEDISPNIWVNTKEIPNNGIDDDGNGYVDDYYGWNFINNSPDPMDDFGHGTHVAGTLSGAGNNGVGVVGVNWNAKIMALKFLNSSGFGSSSDGARALIYAADMGAKVSSNSWSCNCQSQVVDDAVKYEHDKGMVTVTAAGNSSTDALDFSPASSDSVMTIAASDVNDGIASFSNWGEKIDVAAPGVDILSTRASINPLCDAGRTVGTNYCRVSGTSMSTPHVAGLAALLFAKNPSLTNEEVRQIIRTSSVDLGTSGKDKDFGYGRIDAAAALALANTHPLTPMVTSPVSRFVAGGNSLQINGGIGGPNFASYKLELGASRSPNSWTTIANSNTQVTNGLLGSFDTTTYPDNRYTIRLTATDTNGKAYQFQVNDITVDNFDSQIVIPQFFAAKGSVNIIGSAGVKNGLTLSNYVLEWGQGASPSTFSTSGITLNNGGTQTVNSSTLGTWDTSALAPGQTYTLRLTVNATNGNATQFSTTSQIDPDLVSGWPKVFPYTGYSITPPILADLLGDGKKEVIITTYDGKIYAYKKDGSILPGFPFMAQAGDGFYYGATVADLVGDGKKEIIATAGGGNGKIYIVRADGTAYPGWPNPGIGNQGGDDATPVIADLDGDGRKDIVVVGDYGSTTIKIYAYHLDGTQLAGFPKSTITSDALISYGSASIYDMDGDGKYEIAFGNSDKFYLFDNNGNLLPGWPQQSSLHSGDKVTFDSPAVFADSNGDGKYEVFATGIDSTNWNAVLYGWNKDGALVPNYPQSNSQMYYNNNLSRLNSPSVADLDHDGKDEIMAGYSNTGRGIEIFNQFGMTNFTSSVQSYSPPAIVDVDGDGKPEIVGAFHSAVGIAKQDGTSYWTRDFGRVGNYPYFSRPPVLADLDNNGKMEFAANHIGFAQPDGNMIAYLWEIPSSNSTPAQFEWPMPLKDITRSGRFSYIQSDTTPPSGPTNLTSSDHVVSTWSSKNTITMNWTPATDAGSGLSGYSYIFDTSSTTTPDTTQDIAAVTTIASSPLSDGNNYYFHIRAVDSSGNWGAAVHMGPFYIDTTAPSIPGIPSTSSPANNNKPTWTWSISTDSGSGLASTPYNVQWSRDSNFVNGVSSATSVTNSFTHTAALSDGTWYFRVSAKDFVNNQSRYSINGSIVIDTTPPSVTITSPANGATVTKNHTLTITASAADSGGVNKVEFYINGGLTCTDSSSPYTCSWLVPNQKATFTLMAKAYDKKNNSAFASITVTSK